MNRSEARKLKWRDPEYRAAMTAVLRANSPKGRAAAMATIRAWNIPRPGTQQGRLYRKLKEILGHRAAREELGIGR